MREVIDLAFVEHGDLHEFSNGSADMLQYVESVWSKAARCGFYRG